MYLIEHQSVSSTPCDERWALRRRLAERLLDRSRGVSRRTRHLLRRRFIAAWAWVDQADAVDLVARTLDRGGLDRRTAAALRDGAQEHLGFFLDLVSESPLARGTGAVATGTSPGDAAAPAARPAPRPRRLAAPDWPTLFPVGATEGA